MIVDLSRSVEKFKKRNSDTDAFLEIPLFSARYRYSPFLGKAGIYLFSGNAGISLFSEKQALNSFIIMSISIF